MPYRAKFFAVALNPFGVLHTHFKEHKAETGENGKRQQNIHNRNRQNILIRKDSQPCYIYSGYKPYTTGNGQQGAFFYMKNRTLIHKYHLKFIVLNRFIIVNYNSPHMFFQ